MAVQDRADAGGTGRERVATVDTRRAQPVADPFSGERIVRAAIRIGQAVYSVAPPGRHGDVFALDYTALRAAQPDDQGFLTSKGRFVGRREARDIARFAGQIIKQSAGPGSSELFSEDVW